MSRYRFELTAPADDAQLRAIMVQTPMPGMISVAFGREPSYFDASAVEGRFRQAMVVRDGVTGRLVGLGARSIGPRYVNGKATPLGYLSNLRLLERHRGSVLLARGYEFLHSLHQDGRTRLYLTTIAEGNVAALKALRPGRAGLPQYYPLGRYHTLAIPLTRARARAAFASTASVEVRPARMDDVARITEFLQAIGPQRQFFPCYEAGDFFGEGGVLRDLRPEDVLLAVRDGRIVGTLAGWDQQAFRQDVIHGYGWPLNWFRPVYNAWARLVAQPRLPRPGERLRCLMGALPLVEGGDLEVFAALLGELLHRRSGREWDYLLLGMHDSDKLLKAASRFASRRYTTQVFAVCWEDGEAIRSSLDGRPMYLELGSL